MESDYHVVQLSRGNGPAVHRYYDVPCESPDGRRIVYTEFESDAIPGPARVIVADRDGSNARPVGRCTHAIGHVGANPTWVDDRTVSFCPGGPNSGASAMVDVDGDLDALETLDRQLRSFHHGRGLGVLTGGGGGHGGDDALERYRRMKELRLFRRQDGTSEPLLHVDAVSAIHPLADRFDPEHMTFQNPKFSPDGKRLLVVFSNEIYCRPREKKRNIKSIIVLDAAPGAPAPRYLGEFGDHPAWTPDGKAVLVHVHGESGREMTLFDAETADATRLVPDATGIHSTLTADGARIVTDAWNTPEPGRAVILRYDVAAGTRETLAAGSHGAHDHLAGCHPHPQIGRDGRRVIFNMGDTGVPQLYAVDLPDGV